MKTTERKYIQKLEEVITVKDKMLEILADNSNTDVIRFIGLKRMERELESELSSLKAEIPMKEVKSVEEMLAKNYISDKDLKGLNTWDAIVRSVKEYHAQFTTQRQITSMDTHSNNHVSIDDDEFGPVDLTGLEPDIINLKQRQEITDEEIKKWVKVNYPECDLYERSIIFEGAKWMREQGNGIDFREKDK